jgi:hypothetical protein
MQHFQVIQLSARWRGTKLLNTFNHDRTRVANYVTILSFALGPNSGCFEDTVGLPITPRGADITGSGLHIESTTDCVEHRGCAHERRILAVYSASTRNLRRVLQEAHLHLLTVNQPILQLLQAAITQQRNTPRQNSCEIDTSFSFAWVAGLMAKIAGNTALIQT